MELEQQVAALEQQVKVYLSSWLYQRAHTEEALLAGYELGYLQAVVNRTEELFLEQASVHLMKWQRQRYWIPRH